MGSKGRIVVYCFQAVWNKQRDFSFYFEMKLFSVCWLRSVCKTQTWRSLTYVLMLLSESLLLRLHWVCDSGQFFHYCKWGKRDSHTQVEFFVLCRFTVRCAMPSNWKRKTFIIRKIYLSRCETQLFRITPKEKLRTSALWKILYKVKYCFNPKPFFAFYRTTCTNTSIISNNFVKIFIISLWTS